MIITICISTMAIIYDSFGSLSLLLAVTILLLFVFHMNVKAVWGGLKPLLLMISCLFLIQCIFIREGEVLLKLGTVTILTSEGLLGGAEVALRIMILVAVVLLLTTFSSRDFILGLVQLKFPYELAFMVSMAVRFMPLFHEEAVNVITAVQLRGVELKKIPWGKRIELYSQLIFPLTYGVLLKARQMAAAMETRAFRAYPERTYIRRLRFCFADYTVILFSLLTTSALILLQVNNVIRIAARP